MTAIAFRATYADWKLIKTRGVVQVIFEVPLADHDAAYQVVGGMPDPGRERWFGIAPIKPEREVVPNPPTQSKLDAKPSTGLDKPQSRAKQSWEDMLPQKQAGMRLKEPAFAIFLREAYPKEWRETSDANECLKLICGVASKKDLETVHASRMLWKGVDESFKLWERL